MYEMKKDVIVRLAVGYMMVPNTLRTDSDTLLYKIEVNNIEVLITDVENIALNMTNVIINVLKVTGHNVTIDQGEQEVDKTKVMTLEDARNMKK